MLWNPSVCMQQPCTSVWMTLLTKTLLTDLDGEMNKRQYNSKRSADHKQEGETQSDDPHWVAEHCYFYKMWSNGSLTVPLLWGDVTPVLAHREDVLHQEAAVVFSVGCTAVRTLQDLGHVFQQLAALQTWPACSKSGSDCFFGQPEVFCTNEA